MPHAGRGKGEKEERIMTTRPKRILISEDISGSGIEKLKGKYDITTDPDLWKDLSRLEESLTGIEALIVRNQTKVIAPLLARAKDLCVIGRAGTGYDNIEMWQDCWCCSGCPGERTSAS